MPYTMVPRKYCIPKRGNRMHNLSHRVSRGHEFPVCSLEDRCGLDVRGGAKGRVTARGATDPPSLTYSAITPLNLTESRGSSEDRFMPYTWGLRKYCIVLLGNRMHNLSHIPSAGHESGSSDPFVPWRPDV